MGKTPGSAARAKKKLVRRAFPPFTVCFGFASSGSGWCPVPALPSSRKPSGCQRSPLRRTPAAKQIPSARLLPIYSTEAAFQGAPGDSNQIKSLFALQASYLYSPCSEETLQKPDSEVNGMTKRGHSLLQFKPRSGAHSLDLCSACAHRVQTVDMVRNQDPRGSFPLLAFRL